MAAAASATGKTDGLIWYTSRGFEILKSESLPNWTNFFCNFLISVGIKFLLSAAVALGPFGQLGRALFTSIRGGDVKA